MMLEVKPVVSLADLMTHNATHNKLNIDLRYILDISNYGHVYIIKKDMVERCRAKRWLGVGQMLR